MSPHRESALVAGVLYLLTFVSIPTLALYVPVHNPSYILGPGPDTAVVLGGILEVSVALAGVGTAVALFPVLKRQNEGVALGLVGGRGVGHRAICEVQEQTRHLCPRRLTASFAVAQRPRPAARG